MQGKNNHDPSLDRDVFVSSPVVNQRLRENEGRQKEAMNCKYQVIGLNHSCVSYLLIDGALKAVDCVEKVT